MLISGDGGDMINSPLVHTSAAPRLADTGSIAHATVRVLAENRRGELALPRFSLNQARIALPRRAVDLERTLSLAWRYKPEPGAKPDGYSAATAGRSPASYPAAQPHQWQRSSLRPTR